MSDEGRHVMGRQRVSDVADTPTRILHDMKSLVKLATNYHGQRETVLRDFFFRVAKHFTPAVATEGDGLRFYLSTTDTVLGRHTFVHRGFDEEAMRRIVTELGVRTGVPEPLHGRTLLDVGGNIGTTSVYALRLFGAERTLTFEPVPANILLLRQNLLANDVAAAVEVFNMALSDTDADVHLELSSVNSGDHRVRPSLADITLTSHGSFGEQHRDVICVAARRLDTLVAAGTVALDSVALVWIDVQGHEAHVLDGAHTVLDAKLPVAVEYWPYALRRAAGLDRFHALVEEHFSTVVDLGPPWLRHEPKALRACHVRSLESSYTGPHGACDLLLLP
jgi:FkbM family methyltransferase